MKIVLGGIHGGVQRAIYQAYARTKHPGFGALGQVDTSQMYATVETPQGSYRTVRPEFRPLVVNAISHNWKKAHGVEVGGKLVSGQIFTWQPGSGDAGVVLQKMIGDGQWAFVQGDPLALVPGSQLAIIPFDTLGGMFAYISEANVAGLGDGFVIAEGEDVGGPVDKIQRELKRAELGIRYGSIAGAVIGLGIIASIEAKRRIR